MFSMTAGSSPSYSILYVFADIAILKLIICYMMIDFVLVTLWLLKLVDVSIASELYRADLSVD